MRTLLIFLCSWCCLSTCFATRALYGPGAGNRIVWVAPYSTEVFDARLEKVIVNVNLIPKDQVEERISYVTEQFLESPYLLGALGEGPIGMFDQGPLYRTDAFDCLTFVSTVVALVSSNNIDDFKKRINKIRYRDGVPNYARRNHFVSLDWNRNNQRLGAVQDVTAKVVGDPASVKFAEAFINKKKWYKKKQASHLRLQTKPDKRYRDWLLDQFHGTSHKVNNENSRIAYLPLTLLFDDVDNPVQEVWDRIPSGSIVEIVRPNWNLIHEIGTRLNVSHLGFVVRTPQGLMYREASAVHGKVVDVPLIKYLRSAKHVKDIAGINIQQVQVEW